MEQPERFENIFSNADLVSVYTRAQAIADGALVDVTEAASEVGFTIPVAMTRAAWAECVEWTRPGLQDERGRLHDVCWMASIGARQNKGTDRFDFQVLRVPNVDGAPRSPSPVDLWMHCGPGDDLSPVLTLMMVGED